MKRILFCVGLLMASGALGVVQGGDVPVIYGDQLAGGMQQLQLHETVPATPTPAEEQAFTHRNRDLAENLSRAVRHADDAGNIAQLNTLAEQARRAASDAQSYGNARFSSSGGFHSRFSRIAHDAEHRAARLQHPQQLPQVRPLILDDESITTQHRRSPTPPAGAGAETAE